MNLPNILQKGPMQLKIGGSGFPSVTTPFYSGMIEAEPIQLTPQEESKLMDRYVESKGDTRPVGSIIGSGDHQNNPTQEDIERFRRERNKIVPPAVKEDIKKRGGIFHGKHNLNKQYQRRLGKTKASQFIQETYDYDVWVGDPLSRADNMQRKLDQKMKCDIAYAVKQPAPKDSKSRWIVRSRANDDNPEVDYVGYPDPTQHPYRTVSRRGIEYETIESSMAREEVLKHVPMRSFKARRALYNYQQFKHYERGIKNK